MHNLTIFKNWSDGIPPKSVTHKEFTKMVNELGRKGTTYKKIVG